MPPGEKRIVPNTQLCRGGAGGGILSYQVAHGFPEPHHGIRASRLGAAKDLRNLRALLCGNGQLHRNKPREQKGQNARVRRPEGNGTQRIPGPDDGDDG